MIIFRKAIFLIPLICIALIGCSTTKKASKSSKEEATETKSGGEKEGDLKPYDEVITDEAVTQEGLFRVHKIDEKYYYEIPDSLLKREMLLVSRISKTATDLGYGGQKLNTQVVRWQKKDNDILFRHVSFSNVASDSLPIHEAVRNSNLEPIVATFDIKSLGEDSSGVVIDVTDLYSEDIPSLGLQSRQRERYKVRRLDSDRSFINYIHTYPENVEVRKLFTYQAMQPPSNASTNTITVEINHSMVLLPEQPMRARRIDPRVGYFSVSQTDYGSDAQKAERVRYATRYKLVPSDEEAYLRGELVEPVEPIIYYIDSATPEKWRPYLKQGVEDWQEAFEAAGFKNAIIAKDAPTAAEDSAFSPEDARYSVIRYYASDIQNASGPHVHDPRSGQILESDINWYHNIMNLLRNWYFVQTAAANPKARSAKFSDETMGQLIRFVSSHELGHTLGLQHNMAASSAFPVDSLRSKSFTDTHGTAPSIMDYARFNYVAQPGDGVTSLYPAIGEYDKWAIKWAYSWFPERMGRDEIRKTLNTWVKERADDPVYFFSGGGDPRAQTEDLGDDAMKASRYGIANLKKTLNNLVEWTNQPGETYEDLDELYSQIIGQWRRYMGHVVSNIGGVYKTTKTYDQEGEVYEPVPAQKQEAAMDFLIEEAFETPMWMVNNEVLNRINSASSVNEMRSRQAGVLGRILEPMRIGRLIETEARYDGEAYSAYEMMEDLRDGIWSELDSNSEISVYRRNLQRAYLDNMKSLMREELPPEYARYFKSLSVNVSQSDIRPIVVDQLMQLEDQVQQTSSSVRDDATRMHLRNVERRIDRILNPNES